MLFINEKNKSLNVFFIKEHHLEMLKAKKIPLSNLLYLPFYSLSKEDILEWISYQRWMENKYFGKAYTTYTLSSELKNLPAPIHDFDILSVELDRIYRDNTKSYGEGDFSSYHFQDEAITIMSRNDSMIIPGFKMTERNPVAALYQAVVDILGYQKVYFREPVRDQEELGVGLPEVLSLLTK